MVSISFLFGMVLSLSITGSIVLGIIFVMKLLFKNKLSPKWHYYIWFILIIRLVVPFTPQLSLNTNSLMKIIKPLQQNNQSEKSIRVVGNGKSSGNISKAGQNSNVSAGEKHTSIVPKENGKESFGDYKKGVKSGNYFKLNYLLLGSIWLLGMFIILGYIIIVNTIFYRRLSSYRDCDDKHIIEIFEKSKMELGIKKNVRLKYIDFINTPMVFGVKKPTLLISPRVIEKVEEGEIRFIFLHELLHLKRRDLVINWIVIALQAVHWFNPLIWIGFRNMKQDCELACDFAVLKVLSPSEHNSYGQTIISLVKFVGRETLALGAAGITGKTETKRRIKMISRFKRNPFKKVRDFSIVAVTVAITATMAGTFTFIQNDIMAASSQLVKGDNQQKAIISKFNNMLKGTNLSNAVSYMNSNINKLSPGNAGVMVYNFEEAQKKYIPILQKKYEDTKLQQRFIGEYQKYKSLTRLYITKDSALKPILQETKNSGYKVETAEGMFFPIIDYSFYKRYTQYVTKDIKAYIDIMAVESDAAPAKDAALKISWNELINRALNMEKFITTYNSSTRYKDILGVYSNYVSFILYGANNTPLFDYDTNSINASAKNAYSKASQNIGNSKLLGIIHDYLAAMKKGNYKLTAEVKKFRDNASKSITTIYSANTAQKKTSNSENILLSNIKSLAVYGKIINCEYPVKTTVVDDVSKKWGNPDKNEWISAAKGTYATFSKHNVVFGYNKGMQVFEVRSFDPKLKSIHFLEVKNAYGKPAYDVKVGSQEIIGYIVSKDYKLLMVFNQPTKTNTNPSLDHYSVLYPRGTVNNMAEDKGREW